jgi:hypothetical protein
MRKFDYDARFTDGSSNGKESCPPAVPSRYQQRGELPFVSSVAKRDGRRAVGSPGIFEDVPATGLALDETKSRPLHFNGTDTFTLMESLKHAMNMSQTLNESTMPGDLNIFDESFIVLSIKNDIRSPACRKSVPRGRGRKELMPIHVSEVKEEGQEGFVCEEQVQIQRKCSKTALPTYRLQEEIRTLIHEIDALEFTCGKPQTRRSLENGDETLQAFNLPQQRFFYEVEVEEQHSQEGMKAEHGRDTLMDRNARESTQLERRSVMSLPYSSIDASHTLVNVRWMGAVPHYCVVT